MDPIIFTPRLKLTLVAKAERGSAEFDWLHELRSDEQTTWWSITGRSKSIEDTEKFLEHCLPTGEGEEKAYRIVYAVHKIIDSATESAGGESRPAEQKERPTEFIGHIGLASLDAGSLVLPEHLTIPAAAASTTLTVELAYSFLPRGWGKGYATESLNAVFTTCKRARSFWAPFTNVWVRAIVNDENLASQRVMAKTPMKFKGVFEWSGMTLFLAGRWQKEGKIFIYGMHLLD